MARYVTTKRSVTALTSLFPPVKTETYKLLYD